MIKNYTGQRIVVASLTNNNVDGVRDVTEAILEPGGELPYLQVKAGTLQFYKAPDGQPVGSPVKIYLLDNYVDRPTTKFTPADRTDPVNVRTDWREQTSAEEIWGSTKIKLTREKDGWKLPYSKAFNNQWRKDQDKAYTLDSGKDYAIFTIEVYSL